MAERERLRLVVRAVAVLADLLVPERMGPIRQRAPGPEVLAGLATAARPQAASEQRAAAVTGLTEHMAGAAALAAAHRTERQTRGFFSGGLPATANGRSGVIILTKLTITQNYRATAGDMQSGTDRRVLAGDEAGNTRKIQEAI
jgi:hypothetical protein